jgi:hypothetical protein
VFTRKAPERALRPSDIVAGRGGKPVRLTRPDAGRIEVFAAARNVHTRGPDRPFRHRIDHFGGESDHSGARLVGYFSGLLKLLARRAGGRYSEFEIPDHAEDVFSGRVVDLDARRFRSRGRRARRFQEARKAYEKAVELEPQNQLIQQNYDLFKEINDRTKSRSDR